MTLVQFHHFLILTLMTFYVIMMFFTFVTGVPVVPAHRRIHNTIAKIITNNFTSSSKKINIGELGMGYGGQALYLSRIFPQLRFTAFEINPIPLVVARLRMLLAGRKNLTLKKQNFFETDLGRFNVLLCYLSPPIMPKLKKKLQDDLKKRKNPKPLLLISYTLQLPGVKPFKTIDVKGYVFPSKLYVYKLKPQDLV